MGRKKRKSNDVNTHQSSKNEISGFAKQPSSEPAYSEHNVYPVVIKNLNRKTNTKKRTRQCSYDNYDKKLYNVKQQKQQKQQQVGVSDHVIEQKPLFIPDKLEIEDTSSDKKTILSSLVENQSTEELQTDNYNHDTISQGSNYYNEILLRKYITSIEKNDSNHKSNTKKCYLEVRSNWLKRFYSITSVPMTYYEKDPLHHHRPSSTTSFALLLSRCNREEMSYDILKLKSQLHDLKCQFRPLADKCAKALNNHHPFQNIKNTTLEREFALAREKANPMESLGKKQQQKKKNNHNNNYYYYYDTYNPFINRSAMKLANMDALLNFCLTTTTKKDQFATTDGNVDKNPFFSFVDLCGAPGGFTEYILKRKLPFCQGYGMSLSGTNNDGQGVPWKVQHIFSNTNTSNNKNCFQICQGVDGTGDIYKWENVMELKRKISQKKTNGGIGTLSQSLSSELSRKECSRIYHKNQDDDGRLFVGVNLVVADGGFDAQRDEHDQEKMALQIILCQIAAALVLLQGGGNFVIKMFGFQYDVTKQIIQKLFQSFDQLIFLKPVTSRPASSERYLVCLGYKNFNNNSEASSSSNSKDIDKQVISLIHEWREKMLQRLEDLFSSTNTRHTCLDNGTNHELKNGNNSSLQSDSYLNIPLSICLDYMDRDMLQLNVEACKNILFHLERKINQLNDTAIIEDDLEYTYSNRSSNGTSEEVVDGNLYRQAWKIEGSRFG